MTRPPGEYCIDDPIFWDLFLKKLSFCDPDFDVTVIHSLCETLHVPPERVLAKLRAYCHFANPSMAQH